MDEDGLSCYLYSTFPFYYGQGCVNYCGVLVGLPGMLCSDHNKDEYMELHIGCLASPQGSYIAWPDPCPDSPVFPC